MLLNNDRNVIVNFKPGEYMRKMYFFFSETPKALR